MMLEDVHIAQRFRRSIRIDTDLNDEKALDGFVCPEVFIRCIASNGSAHIANGAMRIYVDWTLW